MQIKNLFDASRDIYRSIEKVITYSADQEARLKAEISEYVVTESIEEQFETLLTRMQEALDAGGENEVGVWVSGFYGSGKSSFTKYVGLALDESKTIDGTPFLRHLQDRLNRPQTRALLSTVANRHSPAVVMLDLASSMLTGATMESVSTVLYYKVLQWAGYSRNLKVAAFERKLKKDGRYDEFKTRIESVLGSPWVEVQNDPLVTDSLIPDLAHEFYPALFTTPDAFHTETSDIVQFEDERVEEMLRIVRETTGKEFVVFIIDEVGQYVGSRDHLILNLDGLAKNLKAIGDGKAWIIGTAQQTLTEDDPRAALNSPELFKLSARFPIQIDLESSDIKEICYRRLLGKSPEGQTTLEGLFEKHGQELRHNTKLQDARYYDAEFGNEAFVNLYPFLPAHFDILLHLLGALAKSTGGIGLRSAIKVIQDILVEGPDGQEPVADRPVGWLATTVTLYDALEKDIRRAFPSIHRAVGKVALRFPDSAVHLDVGKTVAALQILSNMPVTTQNVAALLHPSTDASSQQGTVETTVADLLNDALVPFGERDGSFCFFSEKLNDIEQERGQIPLRSVDTRRIQNDAIRDVFTPLPSARLHGTLAVTSGLKAMVGSMVSPQAGEREAIQTIVEFVGPSDYETARTRLLEESRQRASQSTIYLLGRTAPEIEDRVAEIYRCREISKRHQSDADVEVKEYCAAQADRATRLTTELQHQLKRSLAQGSFLFRGQITAVASLDQDVSAAAKSFLGAAAEQVFDRYVEAPVRVETALAEKFLRAGNLQSVGTEIDPLHLVQMTGGTPRIATDHQAITSIRDYIDRQGQVDGKRLIDHFQGAPFGWSQDTLRYLVAAMLLASEVKLRVAGREVSVNGQLAIDALRTNNAFKGVGVSLRDERPSNEILALAAERLTELAGDTVIPLEDEISKVAARQFTQLQHQLGSLDGKLDALGLPGGSVVRDLTQDLSEVLLTDASDAPQRLGSPESSLFQSLKWAIEVERALRNGLEPTIRDLQEHLKGIEALPNTGVPGALLQDVSEDIVRVKEGLAQTNFHESAADLSSALTAIRTRTRTAAIELATEQREALKRAGEELHQLPQWEELTQEEQSDILGQVEGIAVEADEDLAGIAKLLRDSFVIRSRIDRIREGILRTAEERRLSRIEEEREKARRDGKTRLERTIRVPSAITSESDLDELIDSLRQLREELSVYGEIEVAFEIGN